MSGKGKRTIVVTGATKGLGLALANQFAGLGHCVLGCGRTASAVEDLRAKFGPGHDFSVVNVSQREQVEAWSKRLLAAFGPPDLLLNNAALINQNAALWDVPAEEFDALIDVNIKGVFYVMKAFVPAMAERGSGVVINFSSGWGRSVAADVAPILRHQVGSGRFEPSGGSGGAAWTCRGPGQSGNRRHRDAQNLLWRLSPALPLRRRLGAARGAVPARNGSQGQRQAAQRPNLKPTLDFNSVADRCFCATETRNLPRRHARLHH